MISAGASKVVFFLPSSYFGSSMEREELNEGEEGRKEERICEESALRDRGKDETVEVEDEIGR